MDIIHLRSLLIGIFRCLDAYLLHIFNQQGLNFIDVFTFLFQVGSCHFNGAAVWMTCDYLFPMQNLFFPFPSVALKCFYDSILYLYPFYLAGSGHVLKCFRSNVLACDYFMLQDSYCIFGTCDIVKIKLNSVTSGCLQNCVFLSSPISLYHNLLNCIIYCLFRWKNYGMECGIATSCLICFLVDFI